MAAATDTLVAAVLFLLVLIFLQARAREHPYTAIRRSLVDSPAFVHELDERLSVMRWLTPVKLARLHALISNEWSRFPEDRKLKAPMFATKVDEAAVTSDIGSIRLLKTPLSDFEMTTWPVVCSALPKSFI